MIVVDAHTKSLEVWEVAHSTSVGAISFLLSLFAMFGVTRRMMSVNDTAFVSDEIRTFDEPNGVQAVRCTPYHSSTNDTAEHYVAELKKALIENTTSTMQYLFSKFFFSGRTPPSTQNGRYPG